MSTTPVAATQGPVIREVDIERPWLWLEAGWSDFRRTPRVSMIYGGIFAGIGILLALMLLALEAFAFILPVCAAFLLGGPILAVGLYEISRRQQQGLEIDFRASLTGFSQNPTQLALMGVFLMLFALAWFNVARNIFAIFFSGRPPAADMDLLFNVILTVQSLPFLIVGTLTGAVLAALVFTLSVVSIPLLMEHKVDVITAIQTSYRAVHQNRNTMILWAALIAFFTALGIVLFFLGLVVIMPVIGHASWHAYRDLVDWPEGTLAPVELEPVEPDEHVDVSMEPLPPLPLAIRLRLSVAFGILGVYGLFAAANARDAVFYWGGIFLFIFAVIHIFGTVHRMTDDAGKAES